MATIATTVPAAGGTVLALGAANAGTGTDGYRNTGKEMLVVANLGGGSINVTFIAVTRCSQGQLHDNTQAVGAGVTKYMPPVDPAIFNDDTGITKLTFSGVTSVSRGVVSPT